MKLIRYNFLIDCISALKPKTIQFPDIRMAIWSKDIDLINVLKKQIM